MADLVLILQRKTALMSWMQQPGYLDLASPVGPVDRVVVHIEQISKKNRYNKQFTIDLGRCLQRLVNVQTCVVKMSSPHIHRATGPMFKLGNNAIQSCHLTASEGSSLSTNRKRPADDRIAMPPPSTTKRRRTVNSYDNDRSIPSTSTSPTVDTHGPEDEQDVEPDDNVSAGASEDDYRRRKRMSSSIFEYLIDADSSQQDEMGIDVLETVQESWKERRSTRLVTKFDDMGDAFLHAVDEMLCGTSAYKPMIPPSPSMVINRSVVLAAYPDKVYWVVLRCTWNLFTIEQLGETTLNLQLHQTFKLPSTVSYVKNMLDPLLTTAMSVMDASEFLTSVNHIRLADAFECSMYYILFASIRNFVCYLDRKTYVQRMAT